MLGIGLSILVLLSYFFLICKVIVARWCYCDFANNDDEYLEKSCDITCQWMYLHDILVVYFVMMIIFHYVSTAFRSPGVVLPSGPLQMPWSLWNSQGGILRCEAVCNEDLKWKCVALYGKLLAIPKDVKNESSDEGKLDRDSSKDRHNSKIRYIPCLDASYCQKCKLLWPP
jgi:hypothetical protein